MPHYRCSRCEARRTLRPLDEYVRPPRCPRCRGERWRLDTYRATKERGRGPTCWPGRGGCNGYPFPHRRGSGLCWHNPNLTEERERALRGWPLEDASEESMAVP